MAAHGALHQHLDDEHAVDFVGAFKDAVDARIAISAADGIILVETVTAEDLHRLVHHEIEHFAAIDLGDGAFDGVFLEDLHGALGLVATAGSGGHGGFDNAGRAVNHGIDGEDSHGHFGKLFLHQTKFADLLAEGLALFRVFRGGHKHILGTAEAGRTESEAPRIEHVEGDNVAAAHFVEQVFLRHFAIFQEHRRGGAAVDAHLVLFIAGLAAGEILFDDKGGEFFAVHFRKHDEKVRKTAVGDPHFLAVQYVVGSIGAELGARE